MLINTKYILGCTLLASLYLTGCVYIEEDEEEGDSYGYAQYVNLVPQSPDIEFVVEDESEATAIMKGIMKKPTIFLHLHMIITLPLTTLYLTQVFRSTTKKLWICFTKQVRMLSI